MIQSIQKGRFVNAHPLKKLQYQVVVLSGIRRVLDRLTTKKTYRFVMSDAVSQIVDEAQLVKNESVIVLNYGRASWLCREHLKQILAARVKLRLGEQVSPKSKVHFR